MYLSVCLPILSPVTNFSWSVYILFIYLFNENGWMWRPKIRKFICHTLYDFICRLTKSSEPDWNIPGSSLVRSLVMASFSKLSTVFMFLYVLKWTSKKLFEPVFPGRYTAEVYHVTSRVCTLTAALNNTNVMLLPNSVTNAVNSCDSFWGCCQQMSLS